MKPNEGGALRLAGRARARAVPEIATLRSQ